MSKYIKGDGVFKERNGILYVHGTINGKFYRKSTGKSFKKFEKWSKKQNPLKVLAEILNLNISNEGNLIPLKTLKEIAFEAIEIQKVADPISKNHYKDKESVINKKILPYFENIPIKDISVKDLVDWINDLKEKHSYTHVKFCKNLFRSILNYAKNDIRLIDFNPFESEIIKKIDLSWTPNTETYTTEEVGLILSQSIGWLKVFLDLSAKYGFRPGEIMLLKWSDIDFENGIINLQRAYNSDGIIVEYEEVLGNKNHFRKIPLFDSSLELLKNYYTLRLNREWLFVNKDNKPYAQSQSIIKYHLKPLLEDLGIEYKTLYALRRSYASIMNYAELSKESLKETQQVMGHTIGSKVTEKHYIKSDVLTTKNLKSQAKRQEQLFNSMVQTEDK